LFKHLLTRVQRWLNNMTPLSWFICHKKVDFNQKFIISINIWKLINTLKENTCNIRDLNFKKAQIPGLCLLTVELGRKQLVYN